MIGVYLRRYAYNAAFYALCAVSTRAISFFLLPYFLSQLTLVEFGQLEYYQNIFSLGTLIFSSCSAIALVRFYLLYQDDVNKQYAAIANALWGTVIVIVCGIVGAIGYLILVPGVCTEYVLLTLLNIVFFAFFSVVLAYIRMKEKFFWYALFFVGQQLISLGLTVLGVSYGYGLRSFFYANSVSAIVFLPVFFVLLWKYHIGSWGLVYVQLRYSVPLLIYGFLYTSFFSIDRFFIRAQLGYEALGMYALLWRFGQIYQFGAIALSDAWPLVLFNAQKEKDGHALIVQLSTIAFGVYTTLSLATMVFSRCAIALYFSMQYQAVLMYIPLFFIMLLGAEIAKLFQAGLGLSSRTEYTIVLISGALLLQAGFLWLVGGYGLWGVLYAQTSVLLVYCILNYMMSVYVYPERIFDIRRKLILTGCFFVYVGLLQWCIYTHSSWMWTVAICATWPFVLWVLVFTAHERNWVMNLFKNNKGNVEPGTILYLRTDHSYEDLRAGGSVSHTLGVISGLGKAGYKVVVTSSVMHTLLLREPLFYFKSLRVPPLFFFLRWKLGYLRWRLESFFSSFSFFFSLFSLFKKYRFDFIYARYSLLNCTGLLLRWWFQVPLVLEYNGSEVWVYDNWGEQRYFKLNRLARYIEKLNVTHADYLVVVSQPLKDDLVRQGVFGGKILVNPNGVDLDAFDPIALATQRANIRERFGLENKFVVGFVGTFSYWHGIELLAEVIPLVLSQCSQVHFLLIGDGPLKGYLERELSRLGISSASVTLVGFVAQIEAKNYLAACDTFISPTQPNKDGSPFFGSPIKLFEYLSMGKPVIASRLEVLQEIISPACSVEQLQKGSMDKAVGILVDPQDLQGFVVAIIHLALLNKELLYAMGAHARQRAIKNYSWVEHVARIKEFVKEV